MAEIAAPRAETADPRASRERESIATDIAGPPQPAAPTAISQPFTVEPPRAAEPAAAARPLPEAQRPLVASLARLSTHDGTHELTVRLHPADLGAVQVNATISDGALTVSVACADPGAHAAVVAALPNLHQQLRDAGFSGVDVSVGQQSDSRQPPEGQPEQSPPARTSEYAPEPNVVHHERVQPATGLDRLL